MGTLGNVRRTKLFYLSSHTIFDQYKRKILYSAESEKISALQTNMKDYYEKNILIE